MFAAHPQLRFLLSLAFVAAGALAQSADLDGGRRPTFARVENAAGEPAAGAVVTFAGGLPHVGIGVGPHDVLQVETDSRGRAQAKLRPGLCYVAWAVAAPDDRGQRGASAVHEWFGAGSMLTLRLPAPAADERLRVGGEAGWAARGPLRYVAMTSMPGVAEPLAADAAGELVLPPGPFRAIEVRTAAGEPLWFGPTTDEIVVPPPVELRVRVRDEHGAPIAGARIRHRVGRLPPWRLDSVGGVNEDRWRDLGRTDAEGRCVVVVPYAADPLHDAGHGDLLLFADAPGRPPVAGGVFQKSHYVDDRKTGTIHGDELAFTCRAVPPLQGSLGRAPAGAVAHLAAICKLFLERTSYTHDARSLQAEVAADGSFSFDDVPAELHSSRLTIVAPDGSTQAWPAFPAMPGRELPPEVAGRDGGPSAESVTDFSLQFVEPGGGPARGVVALLVPSERRGVLMRDSALRVPLDGRGSASLRIVPGKWVAMVFAKSGFAAKLLDLPPGQCTQTLSMQPPACMRVEVRDGNGQPVVGAQVVTRGTTVRGADDPIQAMLQSMRSHWAANWNQLRTDAEGRVVIPFVPVEGVMQKLKLSWEGGGTPDFVLEASEDWVLVQSG